ncbi:EpsG family protein [Erysipelothrix tonsillarum]|uniref:EpsG family protein n=1 Tax=Erysipelothrix tonsillarum TaxID=38402 RepID=UPI00037621C2|nr:EpsG family protein [Erysipelothrix tonsillarum]
MYYFALLFPFIVNFIPKLTKKQKFYLATLPLFIIVIFRVGVGTDYFSYEYLYNLQNVTTFGKMLDHQTNIELGFRFFIFIFKSIGLPFQFFISFFGVITLGFFIKWIDETSDSSLISLILFIGMFFFVWNLSAIRQGLVMAVASYYFFNPQKNLSRKQSLLLVFVLCLFHISAIFYLPIVFVSKNIKWTKKSLFIILGISFLFAFIPWQRILANLTFIPGYNKITSYIDPQTHVLNFAGIVRILFTTVIIYHYEEITDSVFKKYIVDATLLGFALYFCLKFSEIIAGRTTIYTFILCVIVFKYILDFYFLKESKVLNGFIYTGLICFTGMFLYKDINGYMHQSGYAGNDSFLKFNSIFNRPDYNLYNNRFTYLTTRHKDCKVERDAFLEIQETYPTTDTYNPDLTYYPMWDEGQKAYGILGSDHSWIIEPYFKRKPTVYGSLVAYNKNDEIKDVFKQTHYLDLSGEPLTDTRIQDAIRLEAENRQEIALQPFEVKSYAIENLSENITTLFPFKEEIVKVDYIEFEKPYAYKIFDIEYINYHYFVYVNESFEPIVPVVSNEFYRISPEGVITVTTYCNQRLYNKDGSLLWQY